MPNQKKKRKLAAILFADIVGYSAIMQSDEAAASRMRARHREVFESQHQKFQGEIIQYYGDGVLSIFSSAVQAVECSIEIQKQLQSGSELVPLRIGIHQGDIVHQGAEVYGDGVNIAARIENISAAGAILVSEKLNDDLKNQKHISTKWIGQFELKNIEDAIQVFAITNPGIHVPDQHNLLVKPKIPTKSIAVLPFLNMSNKPDDEYLCDGMTEEIINALTKVKGLRVTSRTSSFYFKGKNIPIPKIGAELNVNTILEGSIRFAGNKMRLTAQLIDVTDDFHFFSETFDRPLDDIFAVQDELSLLIADHLREHLGHLKIDDQLVETPDIELDGYKAYLKARHLILKMNPNDVRQGMEIMRSVVEQNPDYPLAHLGMHFGYTMLGSLGFEPAEKAFTAGQPFLDKAVELNPNLPDCQLQLSYMAFLQAWDIKAAYQHLARCNAIRPTTEYYQTMASILLAEAKYDSAEYHIDTAIQLDPLSSVNYHLKGCIYYCQENYAAAQPYFEKSIEINPSFMASTLYRGQTLILKGKNDEALSHFQSVDDNTGDLMKLGGLTMTYAAMNNRPEAEKGIAELEKALETGMIERSMNFLLMSYGILGDTASAMAVLEKAIEYRLPLIVYAFVEPLLISLRSDERFEGFRTIVLGEREEEKAQQRKYKQQLFSPEALEKAKQQLHQLMDEKSPFLDPDLSLRSLAELMDLSPNHMSQLLNEGFDQNFSNFVNAFRLEAFKRKAADPKERHLTILALAFASGFNSKTAFNTYFKKAMNMTPRDYWKSLS